MLSVLSERGRNRQTTNATLKSIRTTSWQGLLHHSISMRGTCARLTAIWLSHGFSLYDLDVVHHVFVIRAVGRLFRAVERGLSGCQAIRSTVLRLLLLVLLVCGRSWHNVCEELEVLHTCHSVGCEAESETGTRNGTPTSTHRRHDTVYSSSASSRSLRCCGFARPGAVGTSLWRR